MLNAANDSLPARNSLRMNSPTGSKWPFDGSRPTLGHSMANDSFEPILADTEMSTHLGFATRSIPNSVGA